MPVSTATTSEKSTTLASNGTESNPWKIGRCNPEQRPDARRADGQPDRAADERQHDALRQQLANDPPSIGAERFANGHLPCSDGDPGQQKVDDVDAGNEQEDAGRAKQKRDGLPQVSDDMVEEGLGHVDQGKLRDRIRLQLLAARGQLALELTVRPALPQPDEAAIGADVVV